MTPRTHGLSKHPLYHTWYGMLQRCENPRVLAYYNYGGRGIAVCERWHDVRLFIEDIETSIGSRPAGRTASGKLPLYSLDRYPDNDGNYQPGNVRWATPVQQHLNSREPRKYEYNPGVHPEDERWRPVRGYSGWYEVSERGDVYCIARAATHGGPLIPQRNSGGNRVVRLYKYSVVTTVTVGRLVLEAFAWPPPHPKAQARHGPGGPLDDFLENLHWTGGPTVRQLGYHGRRTFPA